MSVVAEGDSLNSIEAKISASVEGIPPQLVQQIANSEFNVLSKLQVLVLGIVGKLKVNNRSSE